MPYLHPRTQCALSLLREVIKPTSSPSVYKWWNLQLTWTPYPEQIKYSLAWFLHNTYTTQDGCMVWNGTCNPYPQIGINHKNYSVHRIIAYYFKVRHLGWRALLTYKRFTVCVHTCDNPPCINPDHLRIDTQLANVWDAIFKGRRPTIYKPC